MKSAAPAAPSAEELGVSRETWEDLATYASLLLKWNARINLVGRTTEADIWRRHVADCLQIERLAPSGGQWADLGAGAGLPGLLVALLRKSAGRCTTLIDSDSRKCAFMQEAARVLDLDVTIENRRLEAPPSKPFDIVSARALAPLPRLLDLAAPYGHDSTVYLFPKGAGASKEIADAQKRWQFHVESFTSVTSPDSSVLRIRALRHASEHETA